MRKLTLVILIGIILLSVAVPAMAGKGSPATEQQGNETGKAKQAGPGGPNYGNPTPPPPEVIPTPSEGGTGTVYRVYLPFVANRVAVSPSTVESVSPNFTIMPR